MRGVKKMFAVHVLLKYFIYIQECDAVYYSSANLNDYTTQ